VVSVAARNNYGLRECSILERSQCCLLP